jgi:hypothetical protein
MAILEREEKVSMQIFSYMAGIPELAADEKLVPLDETRFQHFLQRVTNFRFVLRGKFKSHGLKVSDLSILKPDRHQVQKSKTKNFLTRAV